MAMKKKQWFELLFENYAVTYDRELFTQGTVQEVDFIEKEIGHNRGLSILDAGCGTGRHSVELASRGYRVTGFDLSESQLEAARRKAERAGVTVQFLQLDARCFDLPEKFDLAIMLCEAGFSLMETDEENYSILKNVISALKPNGKLIFTTLSAFYPIFNDLKKFHDENLNSGSMQKHSFDIMTFRDRNIFEAPDDDGNIRRLECNERYYSPSEISWLLKSLGMSDINIYGCTTGQFVKRALEVNDFEMLVISKKTTEKRY